MQAGWWRDGGQAPPSLVGAVCFAPQLVPLLPLLLLFHGFHWAFLFPFPFLKSVFFKYCSQSTHLRIVQWDERPRLPWWLSGKELTCQCRKHRLHLWSGKISLPWNHQVHEPQLLKPESSRAFAPQQEGPPQWEAYVLHLESSPGLQQLEKSLSSNEDPAQPKINNNKKQGLRVDFLNEKLTGWGPVYFNNFFHDSDTLLSLELAAWNKCIPQYPSLYSPLSLTLVSLNQRSRICWQLCCIITGQYTMSLLLLLGFRLNMQLLTHMSLGHYKINIKNGAHPFTFQWMEPQSSQFPCQNPWLLSDSSLILIFHTWPPLSK